MNEIFFYLSVLFYIPVFTIQFYFVDLFLERLEIQTKLYWTMCAFIVLLGASEFILGVRFLQTFLSA